MKSSGVLTIAIAATMVFAACNNASNNSVDNADSANSAKIDSGDIGLQPGETEFMVKATNGGLTEIELSKLAQQNSKNERVKNFADMIIQDHTSANSQLATLAGTKNVTLPDSLSQDSKSDVDKLSRKAGKDFDKDYMKKMVDDHKKTIDDFKDELNDVKNPQLQAWITNTLPTLEKHLDSAQVIDSVIRK